MELNANEIIKALECCNKTREDGMPEIACEECPYSIGGGECKNLERNALALITSQEQRIEAYRQELGEVRIALAEANKERQELTEENERLRAELEQRPPKLIITKLPKKENENV